MPSLVSPSRATAGSGVTGSKRLGIVVVNYGSSGLLARNLANIDLSALPSTAVVVVDNHSSVSERRAVEDLAERHSWNLVASPSNVGFGAGVNLGVERAIDLDCSSFLLLNPDVSIDSASIASLVQEGSRHPMALIMPRLTTPDGTMWSAAGRVDWRSGLTRSRPDRPLDHAEEYLPGTCLLVDRSCWEAVGGFDQRFFLYWEDVDLSRRVVSAGGRLRVLDDVAVVHDAGATQRAEGAAGKSPTYCYYMCRNRLLFATLHLGVGARLRWLLHSPRYAIRVARRDGGRVALRRPAIPLAALSGTAAGAARVLQSVISDRFR
jgi:N-acetylglucosaminyl-diphospho-decaprenol L-rhamnosyltransferase